MLLYAFPDLHWLKKEANTSFEAKKGPNGQSLTNKGWPTVVLNVNTGNVYRDNIQGPLSIFSNLSGESFVEADKRRVRIKSDYFFVTNQRQVYTLEVGKQKAETFNIHFGDHVASHTRLALTASISDALDGKGLAYGENGSFHNKLYQKSDQFNRLVGEIRQSKGDALLLDQKLYELMALLLQENNHVKQTSERITCTRSSTREELLKRLLVAVDWMHAYYETDIAIDDLANAACLSKFHFLRLFKAVFDQTPHQALTQIRMAKSRELLKTSTLDVKEIARAIGYADASTFSRAFHQQTGVYPSAFRAL